MFRQSKKFQEDNGREEDEPNTSTQTPSDSQLSDQPAATVSTIQGCGTSEYVRSAEAKVFRIGDSQLNEAGRDFNIRYCDQKARGGGWTVKNDQK